MPGDYTITGGIVRSIDERHIVDGYGTATGGIIRSIDKIHTGRRVFVGTFSCAQIDLRKVRERELATLDEKSTSSGIAKN